MYFSYNYGRPLENYRDKFEEAVRTALAENFDVQSITFQAEDEIAAMGASIGAAFGGALALTTTSGPGT